MVSLFISGAQNIISIGASGFYPDNIVLSGELLQSDIDATINHIYQARNGWPIIKRKVLNISKAGVKPSGIYKAPINYVLRQNDGEPADAMEQVYVLVNNYGWIVTFP